MAYRKIVIRQMSLLLTGMDIPIYSAIILAPIAKHKELILVAVTVVCKLLLILIEYREANRKIRRHFTEEETADPR